MPRPGSLLQDCSLPSPPSRSPQAARSTDMSDYRLFPHLRATADLLMMPKEVGAQRGAASGQ